MKGGEKVSRISDDAIRYMLARVANHELDAAQTMTIATMVFIDMLAFCAAGVGTPPKRRDVIMTVNEALDKHLDARTAHYAAIMKDVGKGNGT